MDGFNIEHSDSDSGDSWTILDHCPAYGDEPPESAVNNQNLEKDTANLSTEKDEDTDGISIISDSETESPISCEMLQDVNNIAEQSRPAEIQSSQFVSYNPMPPNSNYHEASISSEHDFLGDTTGKHKTYVHRRNKRLSTVLNIIMLGSVITAAGVAIGHMWGARNECAIHTTPSVNKILSNLYKLQEENTYLRNKLKELTLINSLQVQQKKPGEKASFKLQRCKKIYEEPLNSKNMEKITKCIDTDINNVIDKNLHKHLVQPPYEKAFERDIEKLNQVYQQNRSWLDEEIAKRLKHEEEIIRGMVKSPLSSITEEQKVIQEDNLRVPVDFENDQPHIEPGAEKLIQIELDFESNSTDKAVPKAKKVTYADSLKSDQQLHKIGKKEIIVSQDRDYKDQKIKKKVKRNPDVLINEVNVSEEDFKKDNRYSGLKHKLEKKKRDRQKLLKKQKRRNKYEQWEMKGGYMKDYEDFSLTSLQDSENILKKSDGNQLSREFERTHYINQLSETDSIQNFNLNTKPMNVKDKKLNSKNDDTNWYNKRAMLRTEARKRLELELFGETSPSNAGWYFRRMQKREQCRAKGENSTNKKFYKHNMNFKTKH